MPYIAIDSRLSMKNVKHLIYLKIGILDYILDKH
jgi:hypothetical protein